LALLRENVRTDPGTNAGDTEKTRFLGNVTTLGEAYGTSPTLTPAKGQQNREVGKVPTEGAATS